MLIFFKLCVDLPTAFNSIYAIEFDGEKVRIRYEARMRWAAMFAAGSIRTNTESASKTGTEWSATESNKPNF